MSLEARINLLQQRQELTEKYVDKVWEYAELLNKRLDAQREDAARLSELVNKLTELTHLLAEANRLRSRYPVAYAIATVQHGPL